MRRVASLSVLLCLAVLIGCGGGGGSSPTQNVSPSTATPTVTVSAPATNVRLLDTQQFTATVTGLASTSVTWSVNGTVGGSATVGTIDANGKYTAPAVMPASPTITVTATSTFDGSRSGSAQFTLLNPIPTIASVTPGSLDPSGPFTLAITGTRFVSGARVSLGSTALATTFVSPTQLRATGTAALTAGSSASLTVTNPQTSGDTVTLASNPSTVPVNLINSRVAARFLDQATFGATPADIAHVAQIGLQAYLQEQFAATPSTLPDRTALSGGTPPNVQTDFLHNAIAGRDQLRQRLAFALEQIFVISGVTITNPAEYLPFLRIVQQDALPTAGISGSGNFRTLMQDVTLNAAMGDYLNMVNNDKPDPTKGTHANENYARELMQLFTIGLTKLHPDGSPVLDASGNPIPTYDQPTIQEFSRALTGWTYPTQPGRTAPTSGHNPPYYVGPMAAVEANHDTGTKTLLNGTVLPAGQTAAQDLAGALDNIFNDPEVGPFICRNLIEHFVTSNPSGAYMTRCTSAFNNNGSGVRGDLQAVVSEILLDSEARRGDYPSAPNALDGHLREPILFATALLRNLAAVTDGANAEANIANQAINMGQRLLYSPTVFNYYPPDWVAVPASATNPSNVLGPEFAIQTTATATVRANFVNTLMGGFNNNTAITPFTGATIDYTPYATLASDSTVLLDALDVVMMHGSMSSAMRSAIKATVDGIAASSPALRAKTAIYLIGSSSQYQVSH